MEEHILKYTIEMLEDELRVVFRHRVANWWNRALITQYRRNTERRIRSIILAIRTLRLKRDVDCNPAQYPVPLTGMLLKGKMVSRRRE